MIHLSEYIGTSISNKIRKIKAYVMGKSDVREGVGVSASGVDSQPIEGQKVLYLKTSNASEPVVLAVVNEIAEAKGGEIQIYSFDSKGKKKSYVFCKSNGNVELNGNGDNAVRYSKLELAFNELQAKFNTLLLKYNSHTHPVPFAQAISAAATPLSSPTTSQSTPSIGQISLAKIDNLKTS
jgi:hypothetical protein